MFDSALPNSSSSEEELKSEIARLNKIIQALMDRAERSTSVRSSDFSLFQTAIILEEQVRIRTAELEQALRENEKINRALRESEEKFHSLVSQSLVGIVIIENGKFSYSNAKFNEIFGYSAEEVRELGPLDVTDEMDRPLVSENIRKRLSGEMKRVVYLFHGLRKNGEVIDVEVHSSIMEINGKPALIGLIMDVTERIRAEHELQALQKRLLDQSIHDALTGLYNRRYLEETLDRELILSEHNNYPISIIMGDLDHFKMVNDHFGHLAGDEVLRVFGTLLKQHARHGDIYCRYGGEEFLLVLPKVEKPLAIERAEQVRSTMAAAPILYGASAISVTASFGVATFPKDGRTGDELISAADSALYAAKAAGRNRVSASYRQ
ncbi:diguanylate cyclase [Legionella sp. PATHC038]|uniref:sensor domain-containing diguanylate cyclase n=1 Tax=Legionella sheltonii TaxID=2992041 RepID=UPI002243B9CF|nr:diguanylate cyclase [Legionella sp. PATHC038]MCW8400474.1 diguanylate cyclase [Legionella sp. PATHC038]